MIQLIETEDFHDTIESCFKGDRYLYMLYHYESPTGFEESTKFSAAYARDMNWKGATFYTITYKAGLEVTVIGYACIMDNCIWDFYVRKDFREKHMDAVWNEVSAKMPNEFHIRLYDGNYRDINWLIQTQGAKPFLLDKRLFGFHKAAPEKSICTKEEQVYHRELSQILLTFTK